MNHFPIARAWAEARHITEGAEFARFAEQGDNAREFTSVLCGLRALSDIADRDAGNAPGQEPSS
jgi:hypothetical protein